MRMAHLLVSLLTVLLLQGFIRSSRAADEQADRLAHLAAAATSDDAKAARQAIAELRASGPAGLTALRTANAAAIARHAASAGSSQSASDPAWSRIASAVDAVAAQKDAWASGLYWYTDFDAARSAARESGKPILSLRLLGTLDSEFSCANSRFFRTVLYANQDVQRVLRDRFVLHWRSVRPVPRITIDFGDGRVIERTITGNSIHYVLDSDGRVIDGLPGLYGPKAFLARLDEALAARTQAASRPAAAREDFLRAWHAGKAQQITATWQADLARVGAMVVVQPPAPLVNGGNGAVAAPPPALRAANLAVGKGKVEANLVAAIAPDAGALARASDDATWEKIAALHATDATLDAGSRSMIALKNPDAAAANLRSRSKADIETPLVRMVRNFEHSIALDTVRNEYTFHRQIHEWLAAKSSSAAGDLAAHVESLNERVYAELFLTPSTDPWLGLVPPDTYSALPDDGVCRK